MRTSALPHGGPATEAPVLGEELVLDPVERHRHVPAAVDVGMVAAGAVHEEALDLLGAAGEQELLRLPGTDLADARDRDRHRPRVYQSTRPSARTSASRFTHSSTASQ